MRGVGVMLWLVLAPARQAAAPQDAPAAVAVQALPEKLSDADYWLLISDLSEPGGSFRSDNLVSNEIYMQTIIPELQTVVKPGRVYLGVGPEQNFTYIAALKPRMVFIIDVRRGNLHTQMMYKALFELSRDRADFVSKLFSKQQPDGIPASASCCGWSWRPPGRRRLRRTRRRPLPFRPSRKSFQMPTTGC